MDHSLTGMFSGVGRNQGDAAVADFDVHSFAHAESCFIEPIASQTDVGHEWRSWPVPQMGFVTDGANSDLSGAL